MFSFSRFQHWWGLKVVGVDGGGMGGADAPSGACQAAHESWNGIVDVFPGRLAVQAREGREEAFVNGVTKCFRWWVSKGGM